MADPVAWLQIAQGWNVVASDGVIVGTVAQVEGDKQSDIFDGLAVTSKQPTQIRYVPGEQVGAIYPGEVTLKIASGTPGCSSRFTRHRRRQSGFREGSALNSDVEVAAGETLEAASALRQKGRQRRGSTWLESAV